MFSVHRAGAFIFYLQSNFHVPEFNSLLLFDVKQKPKENFRTETLYLQCLNYVPLSCHTSYEAPQIMFLYHSGLKVCISVMLLVLIVIGYGLSLQSVPKHYNIRTKFRENRCSGPKFEIGDFLACMNAHIYTHTDRMLITNVVSSCQE